MVLWRTLNRFHSFTARDLSHPQTPAAAKVELSTFTIEMVLGLRALVFDLNCM